MIFVKDLKSVGDFSVFKACFKYKIKSLFDQYIVNLVTSSIFDNSFKAIPLFSIESFNLLNNFSNYF